jgi:hypothetical protein
MLMRSGTPALMLLVLAISFAHNPSLSPGWGTATAAADGWRQRSAAPTDTRAIHLNRERPGAVDLCGSTACTACGAKGIIDNQHRRSQTAKDGLRLARRSATTRT